MSKLKEFRLERRTVTIEECFVEAENWEDAEEMGYLEEQDWELVYDESNYLTAEEIENDKA